MHVYTFLFQSKHDVSYRNRCTVSKWKDLLFNKVWFSFLRGEACDGASVPIISIASAQSITSLRATWPCVGVISKSVTNNVDQCHKHMRIDHSSRSSARTSIHHARHRYASWRCDAMKSSSIYARKLLHIDIYVYICVYICI